ncbi:MAG TPA: molybdopterin-guanine dinucleotide biosynthesis protein B [Deltaproteobacteria bacterium]|nr:MAG: molybdopterin-guanine dinucleotide biosynthesis protein B [Deltaproteobacteria bacterium]RLB10019.1 MAG: molybdopterin-guanine dinucleotide biosynthesis protein B [Deltaproteobacteria bacterium]HDM78244.1 molybdopterin-guanine dinucleotide biosynthesis protein B [Deltaproteobacteria bacterium]
MAVIVSIVGASKSGKTTLLEKLIPELVSRGYSVGTIKHDVHGFEMDHERKDTWRHRKAGARTVAISGPKQVAMIKQLDKEMDLELVAGYFFDEDIIFTEGYKKELKPKIEVFRKDLIEKPICGEKNNLIAIVTADEVDATVPVFHPENIKELADFLEDRYLKERKRFRLVIKVDGKKLPMKEFVQEFVIGGLLGMLSTLRGYRQPKKLELVLNLDDEEK